MPGRVWTLALWIAGNTVLLALSLAVPMNPAGLRYPWIRVALIVYGLVVIAILLTLRARTPTWFLVLQVLVVIGAVLYLVSIARIVLGAVTTGMALIAVAAYLGFWLPLRQGLWILGAGCAGLLLALGSAGFLPSALVPWAVITALSIGLLVSFGTLVADMNRRLVTDPLTGVLNRSGLAGVLGRETASGIPTPRAIVVMDLDQFKDINDRAGHQAGDEVLREVGDAVRRAIRADDIAVRSGGDEFILILPRTHAAAARDLVTRLRHETRVQFSSGVSEWGADEAFDAALGRADRAMYAEKAERSAPRSPSIAPEDA